MRGQCGEYVFQLCEVMPVNDKNKSRSVQYKDVTAVAQLNVILTQYLALKEKSVITITR